MDVKLVKKHIGETIKARLDKSGLKQKDFAKKIGKEQGNLSKIFKSESIRTDDLVVISEVLDHNFFLDFCDCDFINRIETALSSLNSSAPAKDASRDILYDMLKGKDDEIKKLNDIISELKSKNAVLEYQLSQNTEGSVKNNIIAG